MILKVSLGFARLRDVEMDNFALGVINQMTGNTAYPTPPVTMANLQTARNDYNMKLAAAQVGGPTDTAAKQNAQQVLLGMLRQLASYVQINCNNDMELLLSSRVSSNEHQSGVNSA